jgi:hypothetical protein
MGTNKMNCEQLNRTILIGQAKRATGSSHASATNRHGVFIQSLRVARQTGCTQAPQ